MRSGEARGAGGAGREYDVDVSAGSCAAGGSAFARRSKPSSGEGAADAMASPYVIASPSSVVSEVDAAPL